VFSSGSFFLSFPRNITNTITPASRPAQKSDIRTIAYKGILGSNSTSGSVFNSVFDSVFETISDSVFGSIFGSLFGSTNFGQTYTSKVITPIDLMLVAVSVPKNPKNGNLS